MLHTHRTYSYMYKYIHDTVMECKQIHLGQVRYIQSISISNSLFTQSLCMINVVNSHRAFADRTLHQSKSSTILNNFLLLSLLPIR